VRAEAERLGLRTARKPESMDVCFITRGGRSEFLAARTEPVPGDIVDTDGAVIGHHDGIEHYTVGQRRGTGVALGERRYVVDVDAGRATVTLGRREQLLRDRVTLHDVQWVDEPAPEAVVAVQYRAHGDAVAATVRGDVVRFVERQPRVAPGQAVVVYDGDIVLGGGLALA
jgi:tRNA-specific 2-thiouridylase